MKFINLLSLAAIAIMISCNSSAERVVKKSYSGIYPHLAYYNNEGECGTGAVVPWADRLFVVTYGPHLPNGSSDKLYEIDADLNETIFEGSIGGTPANRMIHRESNQLFIGPYAIDSSRNVRVIPYSQMQGRHTANARHLTDPAGKIMYATMEEGFYDVDVKSLAVETIYPDNNNKKGANNQPQLLEGVHGKGAYSGQGVLVFSNNGEASGGTHKFADIKSGILAEWDGKDWKTIRRSQFVEVTGPGGIYGNPNPETDPIWATGWDHRSIVVAVRDNGAWSFYRLPKASHSYDGAHGWNTEWPRIRNIGTETEPDYLMTMHGMFWKFPKTFSSKSSAGIRPRSSYLKVVGDFARWNDKIVIGCDDSAQKEFLNTRKVKGTLSGSGQSNSNLWFVAPETLDHLGTTEATGAVWLDEEVKQGATSEPMLFNGWTYRSLWLNNSSKSAVDYTLEIDKTGNGQWSALKTISLSPDSSLEVAFSEAEVGEWIRITPSKTGVFSAQFIYRNKDTRTSVSDPMFAGLTTTDKTETIGGLLYALGNNSRALGMISYDFNGTTPTENGYYQLDANMNLEKTECDSIATIIRTKFQTPKDVLTIDGASVLVVDDYNRRWRLPLSPTSQPFYTDQINAGVVRLCREVATERDLFNAQGTFYELPAENADGFAKIRPISSHNLRIHDYASYRGLLLLTGIDAGAKNDHIIVSKDGKAAVWAGTIDDLWQLGKPVGTGGPWTNSDVKKDVASDPYLIGFYDNKTLALSHDSKTPINITMEVSVAGNGKWLTYQTVTIEPGKIFNFTFPETFDARWIRFVANKDCKATTTLTYN
ncbi:MAG: hypothetical protein RR388_00055 [Rikenellaceae bacterium]